MIKCGIGKYSFCSNLKFLICWGYFRLKILRQFFGGGQKYRVGNMVTKALMFHSIFSPPDMYICCPLLKKGELKDWCGQTPATSSDSIIKIAKSCNESTFGCIYFTHVMLIRDLNDGGPVGHLEGVVRSAPGHIHLHVSP